MKRSKSHTVTEWDKLFRDTKFNGLSAWLEDQYGDDDERIIHRVGRFLELLKRAGEEPAIDPALGAVVGRTPCRARVFGGHTDFAGCGGYLINMAGNLEMIYIGQSRGDDQVVLRNMNPNFAPCEFRLGDWDVRPETTIRTSEDWDRWCTQVEGRKKQELRDGLDGPISDGELADRWREYREKNWQEFVKGLVAYLQTDLGDPCGKIRKKIAGFAALFSSEIPMGWGLSSSSALVMSAAQILNTLFDLGLSDGEIINAGYCEHYNGTRGGMNDHAAIIKGVAGRILLMRSLPEEIIRSAKFPTGICLFLVDSGVKRSEAPTLSKRLIREGIEDSAVVLARTGIGYALACLWIRHHFPEYSAGLLSNAADANGSFGLLREFNKLGSIEFENEDQRNCEMYRVLKSMPQRVTREQLFKRLPEFRQELETLFVTHAEPKGGYRLRGMALYGFAENERSIEYLERATSGDFVGMQRLMQISHDGDRAAQYVFPDNGDPVEKRFERPVTDEDLDDWMSDTSRHPVWQRGGYFERSIERVDYLCDLITEYFPDAATARISAAGLGGAATVLAKSAHESEIRASLGEKGFYSISPIEPCAGASIASVDRDGQSTS